MSQLNVSNKNLSSPKNIFVVLGFARSGTSVITHALQTLGVSLGDKLVSHTKNNQWNSKGFFEDKEIIYHIHTKLYAALNHGMRGIKLIEPAEQLSASIAPIKQAAINLLRDRFEKTQHWGFKNPNTAKVMVFWQDIFSELSLNDHYLFALRNPLSSAKSFSNLTGLDLETSLLLWLTHTIPAIDATYMRKSMVLSYELLLEDPLKELKRIQDNFEVKGYLNDIDMFVKSFLEKKLQRNRFSQEDLQSANAMQVAPLCLDVYDLLMKVAKDEITFKSDEFIQKWQQIKTDFAAIYPVYCFLDTLLKRNKIHRDALRDIRKSIFWKMLYPLRIVDDYLRARRRAKRIITHSRVITAYE